MNTDKDEAININVDGKRSDDDVDSHEMLSQPPSPLKGDTQQQSRQAQGVIDPFHNPTDRVAINILSEHCRILSENRFYNPVHEIKKFSSVLNVFAEVCPVIYQKNVKGQLKNLAAYFGKRLLQQHIFVVEVFMNEIRETGFIKNESIYQRLANELEHREWNNDMTEEEKRTLVLRQEAKKQYKRVLPLYTKDLNRMFPNIPCPIDDETLYRTLNIYGGGTTTAGGSPERNSPFQNADKQKIEKEFEMRSRHMKVKSRPQNTYARNDRGRGHVTQPRRRHNPPTTIVRPQYSVGLTKEALQHHHRQQGNMRALNPYANPYEEFWHPYADQPRYPTYAGRRALSDGGFEMEDQGGPQRQERARSDDAGPIYRGPHIRRNVHAGEQSFDVGMHFANPFFDEVQTPPHNGHYSPTHNKHHSPHNSVHSPLSEHHNPPHASHISPRHHQPPQQNHLRQAPTSNKYLRVKRPAIALPTARTMYQQRLKGSQSHISPATFEQIPDKKQTIESLARQAVAIHMMEQACIQMNRNAMYRFINFRRAT